MSPELIALIEAAVAAEAIVQIYPAPPFASYELLTVSVHKGGTVTTYWNSAGELVRVERDKETVAVTVAELIAELNGSRS